MSQSPCLSAALDYLERGWSALPLCPPDHADCSPQHVQRCTNPGKVPVIEWKHLQDGHATEKLLRSWWNRYPTANVGITLGPGSGMLALDLDGQAGEQLLLDLSDGDSPETLEFTTPGGGRRLFYLWPQTPVVNQEYRLGDGELRVLCKGRQTVMPPSLHVNGGTYTWVDTCRPADLTVAPAPAWLLPLLLSAPDAEPHSLLAQRRADSTPSLDLSKDEKMHHARAYLQRSDPAVAGQHGHNQTLKIADKITVGFDLDPDTAAQLILDVYNPHCDPPWSQADVLRKCHEANKTTRNSRGYLIHSRQRLQGPHPMHSPSNSMPMPVLPSTKPVQQPPSPKIISATELLDKELPPVRWAVPNLIPEGASILAGRPKVGKSWLLLQLALAAASGSMALGKIQCEPGDVLYLALEDGERRLQRRLHKILAGERTNCPSCLQLVTEWPPLEKQGLSYLEEWLEKHAHARLVIIDTLARLLGRRDRPAILYEQDYQDIALIQKLVLPRGVGCLIATHTRKPGGSTGSGDNDPLDEVQSTSGRTGAADTILVLRKPRHQPQGTLFLTGRDVEEQKLNLLFDSASARWLITDEPPDPSSGLQRRIVELLRRERGPLGPKAVQAGLGTAEPYDTIKKCVSRLANEGLLSRYGRGKYGLPQAASNS